jgi:menaquinone-9 beta-reductase
VDPSRYDVLVVGAGPAGSTAALVLARNGAKVALLDKARFPRDKACGDFIGPRGLQVLADLGLPEPPGFDVGDMVVMGPSGRRVVLPCFDGTTYPGRARAVPRVVFDDALRTAALEAGAVHVEGRAGDPVGSGGDIGGFEIGGGGRIRADFVIGADGATSHVALRAGLVDEARVLWGFAVRCYVDQAVDLPAITLWEPTRWRAFPGYGWIFPGPDGVANVGLGVGTLADRQSGSTAVRVLPDYFRYLVDQGLLDRIPDRSGPRRLGGWLKMGMVGTVPAESRVLLVGDAAGSRRKRCCTRRGRRRRATGASWPVPTCRTSGSPRPDTLPWWAGPAPSPLWVDCSRRRWSAGPWPEGGGSSGTSCWTEPHPEPPGGWPLRRPGWGGR